MIRLGADAAVVEDAPRFLFQTNDPTEASAAVEAAYYYKDGVEYERLYATPGSGDVRVPGVSQWIVRGYPVRAA